MTRNLTFHFLRTTPGVGSVASAKGTPSEEPGTTYVPSVPTGSMLDKRRLTLPIWTKNGTGDDFNETMAVEGAAS
jgi:hypothetical protein